MGNHTKPFDIDEDGMRPSSYTMAENWGFQVNFMVPLDQKGLERCRTMAARQEEKMRLDYELVRMKNCAELQQKGFMLKPGSRVSSMCDDVIPIAKWEKDLKVSIQAKLEKECKHIQKGCKKWQKQKYQCPKTPKK